MCSIVPLAQKAYVYSVLRLQAKQQLPGLDRCAICDHLIGYMRTNDLWVYKFFWSSYFKSTKTTDYLVCTMAHDGFYTHFYQNL